MTLILSFVTSQFVAQVSDRRLTSPDGVLIDDEANKACVFECQDGIFTISFTGLATLGGDRTDRWLADLLTESKAGQDGMGAAVELIRRAASDRLQHLQLPAHFKSLTFVMAGWHFEQSRERACVWTISNSEDKDGPILAAPTSQLEAFFMRQRFDFEQGKVCLISVNGTENAVDRACRKRMKKLRRAGMENPQKGESICRMMVELVRVAARHPTYGSRIGRSCIATYIPSQSDTVEGWYFPTDVKTPMIYAPHFVKPTISFKDIQSNAPIWLGFEQFGDAGDAEE